MREYLRILKEEPNIVESSMERAPPNLPTARSDMDDPTWYCWRTESLAPHSTLPKMLQLDPIRARARRDREEPRSHKSKQDTVARCLAKDRTDNDEPKVVLSNNEISLPKEIINRTDKHEPSWACSNNESSLPCLNPAIDTPDPNLLKPLIDNMLPIVQ
jgi:hypothetical protein